MFTLFFLLRYLEKHAFLKQSVLLYLICLGSFVEVWNIFILGNFHYKTNFRKIHLSIASGTREWSANWSLSNKFIFIWFCIILLCLSFASCIHLLSVSNAWAKSIVRTKLNIFNSFIVTFKDKLSWATFIFWSILCLLISLSMNLLLVCFVDVMLVTSYWYNTVPRYFMDDFIRMWWLYINKLWYAYDAVHLVLNFKLSQYITCCSTLEVCTVFFEGLSYFCGYHIFGLFFYFIIRWHCSYLVIIINFSFYSYWCIASSYVGF